MTIYNHCGCIASFSLLFAGWSVSHSCCPWDGCYLQLLLRTLGVVVCVDLLNFKNFSLPWSAWKARKIVRDALSKFNMTALPSTLFSAREVACSVVWVDTACFITAGVSIQ